MKRALTYAVSVLVTVVATLFFGAARAQAQAYTPTLFSHKCVVVGSDGTTEGVVCTQLWYAKLGDTTFDVWAVGQAICQPTGVTGANPVQCAGFTGTVGLYGYVGGYRTEMACGNYFGYPACPASRFTRYGKTERADLGYRCGEPKSITAAVYDIRFRLPGSGKIVNRSQWDSSTMYIPNCEEPPWG
jgi:hypothetical protein